MAPDGHKVGLFLEGEAYAARLPPLQRSPAHGFAFSEAGFVNGYFELACGRCHESFRADRAKWLRPVAPRKVSPTNLRQFSSRVVGADSLNFHRVSGLLDPDPGAGRSYDR